MVDKWLVKKYNADNELTNSWSNSREAIDLAEYKLTEQQKEMINVLSQALPFLRKDLGVSQTELAHKVGVSRQMISLIERGLQPMTWTLFLAIIFFFKCNNDFEKGNKKVVQKYPNVVEKILLLEYEMSRSEEEEW